METVSTPTVRTYRIRLEFKGIKVAIAPDEIKAKDQILEHLNSMLPMAETASGLTFIKEDFVTNVEFKEKCTETLNRYTVYYILETECLNDGETETEVIEKTNKQMLNIVHEVERFLNASSGDDNNFVKELTRFG